MNKRDTIIGMDPRTTNSVVPLLDGYERHSNDRNWGHTEL